MNLDNQKYLELLENIALNCSCAAEVYEGYSGRGMYGERCHGITGHDFIGIIESAASHGLTGAKYDNMGRNYIVYWPHPVFSDEALKTWGEEVDPN